MTTHTLQTRLRLVRPPLSPLVQEEDAAARPSARSAARREREVAAANRSASDVSVDQLREVFSSRVAESLEGGKSAILRPERRSRLVDLATRMGIRPFDAHLLIAITQDAARRGEVTPPPAPDEGIATPVSSPQMTVAWSIATALVLGVSLAMLGIAWITMG